MILSIIIAALYKKHLFEKKKIHRQKTQIKQLNLRQSRLTKTRDAPSWLQSKVANERRTEMERVKKKTTLKSKAD